MSKAHSKAISFSRVSGCHYVSGTVLNYGAAAVSGNNLPQHHKGTFPWDTGSNSVATRVLVNEQWCDHPRKGKKQGMKRRDSGKEGSPFRARPQESCVPWDGWGNTMERVAASQRAHVQRPWGGNMMACSKKNQSTWDTWEHATKRNSDVPLSTVGNPRRDSGAPSVYCPVGLAEMRRPSQGPLASSRSN